MAMICIDGASECTGCMMCAEEKGINLSEVKICTSCGEVVENSFYNICNDCAMAVSSRFEKLLAEFSADELKYLNWLYDGNVF